MARISLKENTEAKQNFFLSYSFIYLVELKQTWSMAVVKFLIDLSGLGYGLSLGAGASAAAVAAVLLQSPPVLRHCSPLYTFTTPLSQPQAMWVLLGDTASLVPSRQPSSVKQCTQSRVLMSHT